VALHGIPTATVAPKHVSKRKAELEHAACMEFPQPRWLQNSCCDEMQASKCQGAQSSTGLLHECSLSPSPLHGGRKPPRPHVEAIGNPAHGWGHLW